MRWFLLACALLLSGGSRAQMLQGITAAVKHAAGNTIAITCPGTGSTSSTISCSGTYTGTAPATTGWTYAWNSPLSGSGSVTTVSGISGGSISTITLPTPSGAGAGTVTVTDNLTNTATSGSVTISGPFVGPGNVVSGAALDLSVRAYNAAYATGSNNAVEQTRASDSTTNNIKILANGNYDTASETTFCASTTCTATIAYDQSGNGNNGNSSAGPVVPMCTQGPFAGYSRSFNFQAASSPGFDLGSSSTLNTNALTWVAWIYPTNLSFGDIVSSDGAGSFGGGYFFVRTDGHLEFDQAHLATIGISTGTVSLNTWSMVSISYNQTSGAYEFTINGASSGTGTSVQTLYSGSKYWWGRSTIGDNSFFGCQAELLMYPSKLTATQLNNIYTTTSP